MLSLGNNNICPPSVKNNFYFLVLIQIVLIIILVNVHPLTGEEYDPDLCKGIVCKPKPGVGVCVARNATTLSATAAYGPQRICCSVYACTHANGTTTLHYGMSGQKPLKSSKSSSGSGSVSSKPKKKSKNETCFGITCLGGQPSPNCRKSSPSSVLSLMRLEEDCCPMWTCTFGGNGSLYYFHGGMWQKSTYWKMGSSMEADLSSALIEPPPPPSNNTKTLVGGKKGMKVVAIREQWDITLDYAWGNRFMELERSDSSTCDKVGCVPPQQDLTCGQIKSTEGLKLLAMSTGTCCPVYKCEGKTKMYMVQFGMHWAEPPPNNTVTENPEASGAPPVVIQATTEAMHILTTPKPVIHKPKGRGFERLKQTTANPVVHTSTMANILTTQPTTEVPTTTAAAPEMTTTIKTTTTTKRTKPTTITPKPTKPTKAPVTKKVNVLTTHAPTTVATTTTTPAEEVVPTTATAPPQTTTTLAPKAKTTTTKPAKKTKAPTTKKQVTRAPTTSPPEVIPTTNSPETTPPPSTSGSDNTTPAEVVEIDTPPPPPPPKSGEDPIRNSTVKKSQCHNMKCFPAPNKDKCSVAKITDCELLTLLGSAVDCCPAYKCSSDAGDSYTLQFGISDGVSESVVKSPADEKSPDKKCEDETTESPPTSAQTRYSFDYVNHELYVAPRPFIIFDVVTQHNKLSRKSVRYVKSCKSVKCHPPSGGGWSKARCKKLPKRTVPKKLKAKGVTDSCCSVWRCPSKKGVKSSSSSSSYSIHYGFTRSPKVVIVFEYNGAKVKKLPKYLTLKDSSPEPLKESSLCPDVLCTPPLQNTECVPSRASAIKCPIGSLRRNKECCPLWKCKRKDGSELLMYGRTSPKAYAKKGIQSILMTKPVKGGDGSKKGKKQKKSDDDEDDNGDDEKTEDDDGDLEESDSVVSDDDDVAQQEGEQEEQVEEEEQIESNPYSNNNNNNYNQGPPPPQYQQGPMMTDMQVQNQRMMEMQNAQLNAMQAQNYENMRRMQGGGGGGGNSMVMNQGMGAGGGGGIRIEQRMVMYR